VGVGLLRPRRLAAAALRALGHLLQGDPKPFGERGGLDKGLGRHLAASLERVAVGFALSAVVGVALGMTVGPSKLAIRALDPLFQVLHTVPPLAWLPLSLAAFREA
jgi:nitrate/nitrite transport system permease protein